MNVTATNVACLYVITFEKYWQRLCYGLECDNLKSQLDQIACDRFIVKNECIEDYCASGTPQPTDCEITQPCQITLTDVFVDPSCSFISLNTYK